MVIVGIHVGTPEEQSSKYQEEFPELKKVNIAKLINKLMIERLVKFTKQLGGEMFKVLPVEQAPYQNVYEEKKQLEQEKQKLLLKIKKMEQQLKRNSPDKLKEQEQTTKQENALQQSRKTKDKWIGEGNQHYYAKRYA